MTKAQEKAKRDRAYRRKHRLRYIAHSKAWKARNPDWWKGRKMVQLLTSALVRGNGKSKVFKDAGLVMDNWIDMAPALKNGGLGLLSNGSKLAPIENWQKFNLNDPKDIRAFLDPMNFKLVSK